MSGKIKPPSVRPLYLRELKFLADSPIAMHHPYPGSRHRGTYQTVQDQLMIGITDRNCSLLFEKKKVSSTFWKKIERF